MGVTITYKGKLRQGIEIDAFVQDLQNLARRMGWKSWTYEELLAQGHVGAAGLSGITLTVAANCDSVSFFVDGDRRFSNHFYYSLLHDAALRADFYSSLRDTQREIDTLSRPDDQPKDVDPPTQSVASNPEPEERSNFLKEGAQVNWVRTQAGGVSAHVAVCLLLSYVKERYAPQLEVKDDSGFFKHGDMERLETNLAQVDSILDRMRMAATRLGADPDAGRKALPDTIARLLQYFREARQRMH